MLKFVIIFDHRIDRYDGDIHGKILVELTRAIGVEVSHCRRDSRDWTAGQFDVVSGATC